MYIIVSYISSVTCKVKYVLNRINYMHVGGLKCTGYNKDTSKLEAQWTEPVSLTFHSALSKLNTEPPIGASHQVVVIWLSIYREEDI